MAGGRTRGGWPAPPDDGPGPASGPASPLAAPRRVDFGPFALDEDQGGQPLESGVFALTSGVVFAGRYRLVARIARGGMGSVWSATDDRLGREVAIKFMSPDLADDAEYRQRFEQEARAAARLVSQHVVGIHDHGVVDGVPFIVLERLDGEDLRQRLRREPRLPIALCERLCTHASRALRAAHDAGIIHRDIKPENLFLARPPPGTDEDEIVKLLDFGVAKHAGTDGLHTKTGVLVGSPHFMSPEQVRGQRDIDHRSDLFSLASLLYRCLTGRCPFEGEMPVIMMKITREPAPPPSSIAADLPPALDAFFAKAMALERADRFGSATDMAAAFRAAVTGYAAPRPVAVAAPPPPRAASTSAPTYERRPSDHPTLVGGPMPDAFGPPSSGPPARTSDAPTQVVAASQVLGFTAGGRPSMLPSPWLDQAAPPPPQPLTFVEVDEIDPFGQRRGRMAVVIVGSLVAVLVLLILVLALWG